MPDDAWLAIVIGFSGAVAIVLIGLVRRSVRPAGFRSSLSRSDPAVPAVADPAVPAGTSNATNRSSSLRSRRSTRSRAWAFRSFGPWRRARSVEQILQRACDRIDRVDPFVLPRRIGSMLADTGLLDESAASPEEPRARTTWPLFGQVRRTEDQRDER